MSVAIDINLPCVFGLSFGQKNQPHLGFLTSPNSNYVTKPRGNSGDRDVFSVLLNECAVCANRQIRNVLKNELGGYARDLCKEVGLSIARHYACK